MPGTKKQPRSRILCIDDDSSIRDMIKENLIIHYDVVLSESGKSALEFLDKEMVDVILLDIMMPIMDGFEVIERIKQDEKLKYIPVIFMTGMDSPNAVRKGLELGANDYLTKPFNRIELMARINTQVKLAEAHDLRVEFAQTKTAQSMIVSLNHEINNPLTVLTVQLDLIRRKVDGYDDEFKMMSQAVERIEGLLHKMRQVENVHFQKYRSNSEATMISLPEGDEMEK